MATSGPGGSPAQVLSKDMEGWQLSTVNNRSCCLNLHGSVSLGDKLRSCHGLVGCASIALRSCSAYVANGLYVYRSTVFELPDVTVIVLVDWHDGWLIEADQPASMAFYQLLAEAVPTYPCQGSNFGNWFNIFLESITVNNYEHGDVESESLNPVP